VSDYQPVFTWGHININVSNFDRSVAFYQKFGFEIMMPAIPYLGLKDKEGGALMPQTIASALGLPEGVSGRACIMQLNTGFPKIDLMELIGQRQQKPLKNVDLGLVRICLSSKNLQKDYNYLVEQGVEFLSSPQGCKDGMADIATCVDPDGTLIELIQVYLNKWPRLSVGD